MELPNPPEWRIGPYMLPLNPTERGVGEPANPINRRWIEMTLALLDRLVATGGQSPDNFKTERAMNEERAVLSCIRVAWSIAAGEEPVIRRDFSQHLVKRLQKAGCLPEEAADDV
jgi:hypothetical protein